MPPPKRFPTPSGTPPGGGKGLVALAPEAASDSQTNLQQTLASALGPLMSEVKSLGGKMDNLQQLMVNLQKKSQDLEQGLEDTTKRVTKMECKTSGMNKRQADLEREIVSIQMDRSQTMLRFQDAPETPGDLKEQVAVWLAPTVGMEKEDFKEKILEVYRISTGFIRRNNLPREIHIRLTEKRIRDLILKKANEKQLVFGSAKVKTLKDVPYLVREKRKKFKKLTGLLIQNKISYTWCIPIGLKFVYKTENVKLTSEEKLKDFMDRHGGELGAQGAYFSDPASGGEEEKTREEEEREEVEQDKLEAAMAAMVVRPKKTQSIQRFLRSRDK